MSFATLIDEIRKLSFEEKEEVQKLVGNYLIQERRTQIHRHFLESKREESEGKLKFFSDIENLKRMMK